MIGMKWETLLLFRKIITSKIAPLTIRNLYSGTVLLNRSEDEKKEELSTDTTNENKNKKKSLQKNLESIYDYFKENNIADPVSVLPPRILTQRKSKPEYLYLFDNNAAQHIIELIKNNLLTRSSRVVEVNAGPGILTEKLIEAGVPLVRIMEPNIKFIQMLSRLREKYKNQISIQEVDLFNIWKMAYQDKQDEGGRVAKVFSEFKHIPWGEKPGLKIVGAITNSHFISHVILDTVKQSGIVSYGRPCLYLAMPPTVWLRLTCSGSSGREYRGTTVLFQLFFDYKLLGQVPRQAYLPWAPDYNAKSLAKKTLTEMDRKYMYIVKIEGKKNLFTHIIDEKHIQPLWYFVSHHMTSRTGRIIPHMEAWQPGCGPSLIMHDLNIFTQFGDLSPHQLLELFKLFSSWDGYQNSFIPSMENSPQRMEQLLF